VSELWASATGTLRGVLVLLLLGGGLVVGLVLLAILGFGLYGQVRRLLRTAAEATADMRPRVLALLPPPSTGRHRAG
jgi:hypothetical protein